MTIRSGFFMSVNGDRKYAASFFAEYFASFIGNGVFPNPSTNLQVTQSMNMQTVVKTGKAWVNGYVLFNDDDYVIQHDVADGLLKRIDRVVVRWDNALRDLFIQCKKGTPSTSPVAPVLQRDVDGYEIALADIFINNGAVQITQANITDQRLNASLCGLVTQTVKTVDTTTLFNQYQSWISQEIKKYEVEMTQWTNQQKDAFYFWSNEQANEFETWKNEEKHDFYNWLVTEKEGFETWRENNQLAFDTWQMKEKHDFDAWVLDLEGILSGDVAGNLSLLIEKNETEITSHKEEKATKASYGHVMVGDGISVKDGVITADLENINSDLLNLAYQLKVSNLINDDSLKTVYIDTANDLIVEKGVLTNGKVCI